VLHFFLDLLMLVYNKMTDYQFINNSFWMQVEKIDAAVMKIIVKIIYDDLQLIAQRKALEQIGKISTALWMPDQEITDLQRLDSVEPESFKSQALLNQPSFNKTNSHTRTSEKR